MSDVMAVTFVCVVLVMLVAIIGLSRQLKEKQTNLERLSTAYLAMSRKLQRMREVMDSVR